MRILERTGLALTATCVLLACCAKASWAQEALDTGRGYNFGPELEDLPAAPPDYWNLTRLQPRSGGDPRGVGSQIPPHSREDCDDDPSHGHELGSGTIMHVPTGLFVNPGYGDEERQPDRGWADSNPYGRYAPVRGEDDDEDLGIDLGYRYGFDGDFDLGLSYGADDDQDEEVESYITPHPGWPGTGDFELPEGFDEDSSEGDSQPQGESSLDLIEGLPHVAFDFPIGERDCDFCDQEEQMPQQPGQGPEYEYQEIGEPWDSLARSMRARNDRRAGERDRDRALDDHREISAELDVLEAGPYNARALEDARGRLEHAGHRRDRANSQIRDATAEEESARTANAHAVAEFEREQAARKVESEQTSEAGPAADEGTPIYRATRRFIEIDRRHAFEDALDQLFSGEGSIEAVEEAHADLAPFHRR